MSRALRIVATSLAIHVACASCAVVLERGAETEAWRAPALRDHRLAGVIWDVRAQRRIGREALAARLAVHDLVLLGDKHDNPDHHRLQAELISALVARGRRPAIALEPITLDRGAALAGVLAAPAVSAGDVVAAVARAESAWPWALYEPVLAVALAARLPIVAADLDPAALRALRASGVGGLDPALVRRLALDETRLDADRRAVVAADIRLSHCGHVPEAAVEQMVDTQVARDAQLARALVDAAAAADGAVLIAGTGHVRRDVAVPLHLARFAPAARVVSLAFLEVSPEHETISAALAERFGADAPFDYVWFTPRVDLDDPCTRFREQLERMRERAAHGQAPAP